MIFFLSEASII